MSYSISRTVIGCKSFDLQARSVMRCVQPKYLPAGAGVSVVISFRIIRQPSAMFPAGPDILKSST